VCRVTNSEVYTLRINSLKTFVEFCQSDCDTNTYKKLSIPRSTMWSHVDEVEEFLNRILIKRGRPNYLTVEGKRFLPIAKQLVASFDVGLGQLQSSSMEAKGEIIVSTTAASITWLIPSIKEFHDLYPNLKISIVAEDNISSSVSAQADVFLRPFASDAPEGFHLNWHIAYHMALFASREYVAKYGMPTSPADLKQHCILAYGEYFQGVPHVDWHLKGKMYGLPPLEATLRINSTRALFDAAINGIGIISNPIESLAIYREDLVHILPTVKGPVIQTKFCTRITNDEQKNVNMSIFSSFFKKNLPSLGITIIDDDHHLKGDKA
jgi:DNA-binding transcriptional LysR family regulator